MWSLGLLRESVLPIGSITPYPVSELHDATTSVKPCMKVLWPYTLWKFATVCAMAVGRLTDAVWLGVCELTVCFSSLTVEWSVDHVLSHGVDRDLCDPPPWGGGQESVGKSFKAVSRGTGICERVSWAVKASRQPSATVCLAYARWGQRSPLPWVIVVCVGSFLRGSMGLIGLYSIKCG